MAGSMKDIKLRIKSVESTMQITKAMELVASSKMRRAKERVEHSRPYFETLYESLTKIAAADPRARNPYLRRDDIKRTLLVVIAGDRGLAGGYNANVFKQADAAEGPVTVLPIGKRSAEYFAHHGAGLFTPEVLMAADVSVSECFTLSHQITEGFLKGEYDAVKLCYTRFDSMMTQTATTLEVLPLTIEPTEAQKAEARRSQILYKPSCEEVFGAIIPEYVAGVLYGAVCESVASELASSPRVKRGGGGGGPPPPPPHRHGCRHQECRRDDRASESVLQPRPSGCHHAGDHRDRGWCGKLRQLALSGIACAMPPLPKGEA